MLVKYSCGFKILKVHVTLSVQFVAMISSNALLAGTPMWLNIGVQENLAN
jgi:hypothetical protein